mmetsp:Transcript_20196/g.46600  ORF Transcript_20196/g.46600 Transcript_20196/m.46600 type:complete len:604 (-) Transcript_20196:264-2075(-)
MSVRQLFEFERLFLCTDERLLFCSAMDGSLRGCPVRGLVWRHLLSSLPAGPPSARLAALAEQTSNARLEYALLREKHCTDPRSCGKSLDIQLANPLSQAADSPWSEFFEFEELREEIKKDLTRLHPGLSFFSEPRVQEGMGRILFVWCKLHPALSYRQGMHELLAPLYRVLEAEAAEAASAPLVEAGGLPSKAVSQLRLLLAADGAEADAYALFDRLMRQMGAWFEVGPRLVRTNSRSSEGARTPRTTPLLRKCAHIQDVLLPKVDAPLHARLRQLDVEPQLYLLRWLRLLYSGEFELEDVMVVWDALFAHGQALQLVDYLALAMLVYVRSTILSQENAVVLRRLLHFNSPAIEDVHSLVERALALCRSLNGPAPSQQRLSSPLSSQQRPSRQTPASASTLTPAPVPTPTRAPAPAPTAARTAAPTTAPTPAPPLSSTTPVGQLRGSSAGTGTHEGTAAQPRGMPLPAPAPLPAPGPVPFAPSAPPTEVYNAPKTLRGCEAAAAASPPAAASARPATWNGSATAAGCDAQVQRTVPCAQLVELMEKPLRELTLRLLPSDELLLRDPLGASGSGREDCAAMIRALAELRAVQGVLRDAACGAPL